MPHVDEGTLHAWLDGALRADDPDAAAAVEHHIESCADCRARLEQARRQRDQAGAILAHAEPDHVDVPPFEEIAERARARSVRSGEAPDATTAGAARSEAGRGDPGGAEDAGLGTAEATSRRGRRARIPLAWAASIAIAVAGGWWARELALPTADPVATRASGSAATRPAQPDEAGRRALPPSARTEVEPSTRSPETTGAPSDLAEAARLSANDQREPEPAARTAAPASDAVDRSAPSPPPTEVAAADRRTREPTADAAVAPAAPTTDAPAAPIADGVADAPPGAPPPDDWRPATHAEAERWVGGPIYAVPDAPVVEFTLGGTEAEPVVRTRQRLPDGTLLGLIQRPSPEGEALPRARTGAAEAARSMAEAPAAIRVPAALTLAETADTVSDTATQPVPTLDVAGFRLRPQAALPADSLRSLLRRVRPYEGPSHP